MSTFQIYLYIWAGLTVLSIAASQLTKRISGGKPATDVDCVKAAFALGGAITLFRVLLQVMTQPSLHTALEWDGILALCISSALGIKLCLEEFKNLLF